MASRLNSADTTWTGFELGGRAFALPAGLVERIGTASAVTALPFAPAGVEGVASVAGDVIPVVTPAALLFPEQAERSQAGGRFLVMRVSGHRFALRIEQLLFVASALVIGAEGQALWRDRAVNCVSPEKLQLSALEPWSPPTGTPGPVADSRDARPESRTAPAQAMVLAVEAAGRLCGLPSGSIVELLEQASVTPLPLVSPALNGVMVLRGQPILAFRLDRLLGHETAAPRSVVVLGAGRGRIALLVDAILGLQRATADHLLVDPADLIGAEGLALAAQMPGAAANGGPAHDERRHRFLCVTVAGRTYGLTLAAVERVLPPRQSVVLPAGAPDGIDGAIEYGGRIIPVTDGWRWLSLADTGSAGAHVVLRQDGEQRALAVSSVQRITAIAHDDILPTGGHDPRIEALATANGRSVEILSMAALLARKEAA